MKEKSLLTKMWEKSDEYDNALRDYLSSLPNRISYSLKDFRLSRQFANGRWLFRKRINGCGDGNSG